MSELEINKLVVTESAEINHVQNKTEIYDASNPLNGDCFVNRKSVIFRSIEPFHDQHNSQRTHKRNTIFATYYVRTTQQVLRKYSAEEVPSLRDCFGAEDNPANNGKGKSQEDLQGFFPCWQQASFGNLVGVFAVLAQKNEREEKQSVIGAPSNKRPIGTVPEAGKQEDDECIADNEPFLVTVRILDRSRNFGT